MPYIGRVYTADLSDVIGALILDGVPGELIDIRDAYYGNAVEVWVLEEDPPVMEFGEAGPWDMAFDRDESMDPTDWLCEEDELPF